METFDTKPPAFSNEELNAIVEKKFHKKAILKPLVSERDQNAHVKAEDGEYVLKIANAAEDRDFLEFQNAVLNHIAMIDPTLAIPAVIKGTDEKGAEKEILTLKNSKNEDQIHYVRLLSFLKGNIFSAAEKNLSLYSDLGRFMGRFSKAMQGFGHPKAHQPDFLWNMDNALFCKKYIDDIEDTENSKLIKGYFDRYDRLIAPKLPKLRAAVIHHDANDNNLVVKDDKISGLIDFGDMVFAKQIYELATVLAYALMDVDDLFSVSHTIIASYSTEFPLTEDELAIVFDLAAMRLVMSVCISSNRAAAASDNTHKDYLLISQAPALRLLKRLQKIDLAFLSCLARKAGGYDAVKNLGAVIKSIKSVIPNNIFDFDLDKEPRLLLDLNKDGKDAEHLTNPKKHTEWVNNRLKQENARFAIGNYGEDKNGLTTDDVKSNGNNEFRTKHLALDFWVAPGTTVNSPLDGIIHSIANNDDQYDYGYTVIMKHKLSDIAPEFYTLYGHLSAETMNVVKVGQKITAGETIGFIGTSEENGGWSPHLHFQILTTLLEQNNGNFPGGCEPSLWPIWQEICPDPNLIVSLAPESFERNTLTAEAMMKKRASVLAPSLSVAYKKHIHMVRGKGAYLYDNTGRAFLDCVNNITHVGHCNPHVVNALSKQAAILNTNSRYLYNNINQFAARILDTMPDPLSVMFFANSGSEANELALRLSRTATGRKNAVVVDWGYHGNTNALVEISPYKFNRKGGKGCPKHVRIAEFPDPYQGRFKGLGNNNGEKYAASVDNCIADLIDKTGEGPATFIAESIAGVGGQVIYPDGYLKAVYKKIRAAGGLCIADEVQVGFGRVGDHMWGFERQGVVPDIVVLGKPIGNGHPMSAVITTREIADKFANGMEYFNSFGGNPVSCAVGMAVMDVVEGEGLQQKAFETGKYILNGLKDMMQRHPLIGDVRGTGLFIGAELVKNRETQEVAPDEADTIIQYLREDGVLLSTDGPYANVLKLKPPMVFGIKEADIFLDKLEKAFIKLER